jgi:fused signal recognition particle receptor
VALEKTRRGLFGRIGGVFQRSQIDDELWEELEEIMVAGDVGLETAEHILERVRDRHKREGLKRPEEVRDVLKDELVSVLTAPPALGTLFGTDDEEVPSPSIILVVGVNGAGKTTSIAKLAASFQEDGEKVVLAAADTFRAAAIEQLKTWGQRIGAQVIAHQQNSDPGAVVYDAIEATEARDADVLIIDTAGRLHTEYNLMQELSKLRRIINRKYPDAPDEVLLVIDATTGQNGLLQAQAFTEAVEVTGILLAKLDGTAKGGIVFAIAERLGIPVRFIGTGEKATDLAVFDAEEFVDALFGETAPPD